jgi:hypothetical protein
VLGVAPGGVRGGGWWGQCGRARHTAAGQGLRAPPAAFRPAPPAAKPAPPPPGLPSRRPPPPPAPAHPQPVRGDDEPAVPPRQLAARHGGVARHVAAVVGVADGPRHGQRAVDAPRAEQLDHGPARGLGRATGRGACLAEWTAGAGTCCLLRDGATSDRDRRGGRERPWGGAGLRHELLAHPPRGGPAAPLTPLTPCNHCWAEGAPRAPPRPLPSGPRLLRPAPPHPTLIPCPLCPLHTSSCWLRDPLDSDSHSQAHSHSQAPAPPPALPSPTCTRRVSSLVLAGPSLWSMDSATPSARPPPPPISPPSVAPSPPPPSPGSSHDTITVRESPTLALSTQGTPAACRGGAGRPDVVTP